MSLAVFPYYYPSKFSQLAQISYGTAKVISAPRRMADVDRSSKFEVQGSRFFATLYPPSSVAALPSCVFRGLFFYTIATTAFIFSSPVFATPTGSSAQYFRLNSSNDKTFLPPVSRNVRNNSGKGATPSPG